MRRRPVLALVAAGALVLAACGDDDTSDDDTSDDESETTEAAGEETDSTEGEEAETTDGEEAETTEAEETDTTEGESAEPGEDWPDELVFTLTPSQEAGGLIETAEPLAEMLSERLGVDVRAEVPTDYSAVIAALSSGQAHVAGGLGPDQMVRAEEEANGTMILQSERFGSLLYVTQWFTNDPDTFCEDEPVADDEGLMFCNGVLDAAGPEDGPIGEDHLTDVEGQSVAFVEQGSTSGYKIPALQLHQAGVDPIDSIEAQFAGGHDTAVQAVYDGDATVGVSFNDARGDLVEQHPDVGEKVVVFGWSGPIPNDGFAVSGELPDALTEAITDAFVDIAGDEEGATLLNELYEIDDLVPVESSDYDVIRELNEELGDVLE